MMELIYPHWSAPSNVRAVTSTRIGGVSVAPYHSLNVGDHVGDDSAHVSQNRQLLLEYIHRSMGLNDTIELTPQWLRQEHTCNVVVDSTGDQYFMAYDGQFTQKKHVMCAIMTADCMPVFICNEAGTSVALVHAGWRGLADGIVEKTLALFSDTADQLLVHCGPAISQTHFEIGDEVREQIGGAERFYRRHLEKSDHCYADLVGLLGERVDTFGAKYTHSNHCTFADVDRFFSYRRDGVTGRMVSFLWME